ncbi:glycosyltransferase family 2 protein [Mesonia sp. K7]|uniref:glycosyltransferase family 2 protein n=1 Tax=Mesonia sp. K7 TaxID=2218606 RepID=UPI000DAA7B2E|nr:glycosyltransferase [Mesonia sp. K7]PZD78053.1 glycosyltransferase family 2 protein [Mesonia sp. K7]
MISVLIPTYNYPIFPLVQKIHLLLEREKIEFEIICFDDGSPEISFIEANKKINSLSNSSYHVLPENIGRSKIRNLLADTAKYDWLLFLDADVIPIKNNFIKNYLNYTSAHYDIVYGGIRYEPQIDNSSNLRWHYGNAREALDAKKRNEKPYISFLTLNFLIKKSVFQKVRFNEEIPNLRHEDTLFSYQLKQAKVPIFHIENPVYHLGIESSKVFLRKSIESIEGALYLQNHKLIDPNYIKLLSIRQKLKKVKLESGISIIPQKIIRKIERNLLGNKPSLRLFDFYRLYHLIQLEKNA